MKHTELGSLITRYRFRAGLTQTDLAQRAELSLASVQKLEQGVKNNPRLATVQSIANELKIRMIDLIPEGYEGADVGKLPPIRPIAEGTTKDRV
jgi:transcriptional regulator with XRE-family HTH domain